MLLGANERINDLQLAGVPYAFLKSLAASKLPESLDSIIEEPEGTYWYYGRHPSVWEKYAAEVITPIGALPSGGQFFDLITKDGERLFTLNILEGDWYVIGRSLGEFAQYLAEQAYELHDEIEISQISGDLKKLGFPDTLEFLMEKERKNV